MFSQNCQASDTEVAVERALERLEKMRRASKNTVVVAEQEKLENATKERRRKMTAQNLVEQEHQAQEREKAMQEQQREEHEAKKKHEQEAKAQEEKVSWHNCSCAFSEIVILALLDGKTSVEDASKKRKEFYFRKISSHVAEANTERWFGCTQATCTNKTHPCNATKEDRDQKSRTGCNRNECMWVSLVGQFRQCIYIFAIFSLASQTSSQCQAGEAQTAGSKS